MSYLQDKKEKRKKNYEIALGVLVLAVLFFFRLDIFRGLAFAGESVFDPILVVGKNIEGKLGNLGSYLVSKNSLYLENENLKSQISESAADRANYASVVADNAELKEILGRKDPQAIMVLAAILSKPNQSPYDTLLIDAGSAQSVKTGDTVFALGDVPIGLVSDVYQNSSKVVLFSSPGEETEAVISGENIFTQIVGRGGGDFEITLPKDSTLSEGVQVTLPGINDYVLATVQKIIVDPRNPFIKALLASPVNIQEQKFVEVEE